MIIILDHIATIRIPAGTTRVEFTVSITDDDIQEDKETFHLSIINNLSEWHHFC